MTTKQVHKTAKVVVVIWLVPLCYEESIDRSQNPQDKNKIEK